MKKIISILAFIAFSLCSFSQAALRTYSIDTDSTEREMMLGELTVKGQRPTVRRTADKIIVSVENSEYLKSRTLDKILNVSPGVSLSQDGELSINGISGVTLVVNGKTLRLSGNDLVSYIKSIKGADLKDIEIIPHVTAQYEAEGVAGVLNINTKRSHAKGLSGYTASDFSHTMGGRRTNGLTKSAGLNFTVGSFTVYGTYSYLYSHSFFGSRYTETDNSTTYDNSKWFKSRRIRHTYKVGFDWDINSRHYIGMEYNGSTGDNRTYGSCDDTRISGGGLPERIIYGGSPFVYSGPTNMMNFNYVWKTDTAGSRLSVTADYTGKKLNLYDGYENHYLDAALAEDSLVNKKHLSDESIDIYSAQIDFTKVLGRNMRLSLGAKYVNVKTHYMTSFFTKRDGRDDVFVEEYGQHDNFTYTEQRAAAYAMFEFKGKRFQGNAGLRGEYTWTDADSKVQDKNQRHDDDFRLFPMVSLGYKTGTDNLWSLYYGMRISRPSYTFVNPYVNYMSDVSAKAGNPWLKPEITNNAGLAFSLHNRYYFALSATFAHNTFMMCNVRGKDGVTLTMPQNMGHFNSYMFYASIPVMAGMWNCYNTINIGYRECADGDKKIPSFNMYMSSNNTFEITERLSCGLGMKFVPRNTVMYRKIMRTFFGIDLSATYLMFNKKLSVSAGVDDLINSGRLYHELYGQDAMRRETWDSGDGRMLYVSLRYDFGFGKKSDQRTKRVSGQDERRRM